MAGVRRCLEVTVGSTSALKENRANNRNDPFAVVRLGSVEYRTDTGGTTGSRPVWNHRFSFILPEDARKYVEKLHVEVWDHGENGADRFIGSCSVNLAGVYERGVMDAVQAVHRKSGKLLGHMRFHFCVLVEDPSPDRDTPSPPPMERVRPSAASKAQTVKARAAAAAAEISSSSHALGSVKIEQKQEEAEGTGHAAGVSAAATVDPLSDLWRHIQIALQQAQIQQLQNDLQQQQADLLQAQQEQQQTRNSSSIPKLQQRDPLLAPDGSLALEGGRDSLRAFCRDSSSSLPFAALAESLQQAQGYPPSKVKTETATYPAKPQVQHESILPPRPVAQLRTATGSSNPSPPPASNTSNRDAPQSRGEAAWGAPPPYDFLDTSAQTQALFPVQMKKDLKPPPLDLSTVSSAPSAHPSPNSPSIFFQSPTFSSLSSPALWSPLATPPPSMFSTFSPTSPFFKSAFSAIKPLPALAQHEDLHPSPKPFFESSLVSTTPPSRASDPLPPHDSAVQVAHPKAVSPQNLDLSAIAQLASSLGPKGAAQKGGRGSGGSPGFAFSSQENIAEALSQAFWGAKGGPQPEGGKGPELNPVLPVNPKAELSRNASDKDPTDKEHPFLAIARPTVQIPMGGKNSAFSDRRNSPSSSSLSRDSPQSLKRSQSDELVLDFELGTPHGGSLPKEVAPWAEPKRQRLTVS